MWHLEFLLIVQRNIFITITSADAHPFGAFDWKSTQSVSPYGPCSVISENTCLNRCTTRNARRDGAGPATWHCVAPAAKGTHQSPVNIAASDVTYDEELSKRPLSIHYDACSCKAITNNGHSLQVVVDAQDTCKWKIESLLFSSRSTESQLWGPIVCTHYPSVQLFLT